MKENNKKRYTLKYCSLYSVQFIAFNKISYIKNAFETRKVCFIIGAIHIIHSKQQQKSHLNERKKIAINKFYEKFLFKSPMESKTLRKKRSSLLFEGNLFSFYYHPHIEHKKKYFFIYEVIHEFDQTPLNHLR